MVTCTYVFLSVCCSQRPLYNMHVLSQLQPGPAQSGGRGRCRPPGGQRMGGGGLAGVGGWGEGVTHQGGIGRCNYYIDRCIS